MPENVIIVGSGPAGLTAAIYTARANLQPLVIEGAAPYGQLMLTTEVENFPGFPDGILGPELMEKFRSQAARFGAKFITADATSVDFSKRPFIVQVGEASYDASSVILATGAKARMLEVPGERDLLGRGVSTCATCDGFFFRGKEIAVVGGGDSALEEAMFLTKFGSKVTVIHRRDSLRASKIMQERAFANPKLAFVWDSVVEQVHGDGAVTGASLRNLKTGQTSEFATDALFVAIGHDPQTELVRGQLDVDHNGYVVAVDSPHTNTSVEGVFACGDAVDHVFRQAITAAGTGCAAAIDAERYLESVGH